MSVFFRWGIFGIVGVAALLYAYNSSKNMAAKHAAQPAVSETARAEPPPEAESESESESGPEPATASPSPYATAPHCLVELEVAQRALAARRQGEPLDRLLRIREIAFEEPVRRQRLEKVATRWYEFEGDEPIPEALRVGVISDCVRFSPAP